MTGGLNAKGSVAIQLDGKIVVAVEQWEELRYEPSPEYHGFLRLNSNGLWMNLLVILAQQITQ